MRQAHRGFRILLADGRIQRSHLLESVVEQRREHLLHEFFVVHGGVPELLPVQYRVFIEYPHFSILACGRSRGNRTKTLEEWGFALSADAAHRTGMSLPPRACPGPPPR